MPSDELKLDNDLTLIFWHFHTLERIKDADALLALMQNSYKVDDPNKDKKGMFTQAVRELLERYKQETLDNGMALIRKLPT
jgi:hypothetical protein